MVGYTQEELAWKNGLSSERSQVYASTALELSKTFNINRNEVISLVNKHYWDVWDVDSYIKNFVKNNYPIRTKDNK